MLALVVLTVIGYAAAARLPIPLDHQVDAIVRLDLDLGTGTPDDGPVNVLLAGVGPGELAGIVAADPASWVAGSHRAESITVLHLPADRQHAYLVSVPRDAWVNIAGHGPGRVDAAFSYGGPALLVDAVEGLTGLSVDHLALAEWGGFDYLTDGLGGWSIEVDGTVMTFGAAGLAPVRDVSALPAGEPERIQREQDLLRSVSAEVMSNDTLTNPLRLRYALDAAARSVAVDKGLTTDRLRSLARSLHDLGPDEIVQLTVPVEPLGQIDGQSVSVVDPAATRELLGALAGDAPHG
jgi:anionic cell wall polymer biosynthesis LytR-Cps2A-Psr (LCP) family protein